MCKGILIAWIPVMSLDWIGLDWNALFHVGKIVGKKIKLMNAQQKFQLISIDMSICLIKVNVKNNNNNNNNNNNEDQLDK